MMSLEVVVAIIYSGVPVPEDYLLIANLEHFRFLLQTKAHLDVLADALLRWARGR